MQFGTAQVRKIVLPIAFVAASGGYVFADKVWLTPPPKPDLYDMLEAAVPFTPGPDAGPVTFVDGVYRGPKADAYYGYVEVVATVRDGRLAEVRVAHSPKSSSVSTMINGRAMPKLRREAIAAQSGYVDFVTGATLSSKAFSESLIGALQDAAK